MKVVADRNAADSEPLDKIVVNKILRRGFGAALVESQDHGARESRCGQKAELCSLIGETELRGVRAEIASRMRLEGHRESRSAMGQPHAPGGVNDRTMAKMDAVEIAHCDHHSLGDGGRRAGVADHGKFGGHLQSLSSYGRTDRDVARWTKSSRGVIGF